jgi:MFS family permease
MHAIKSFLTPSYEGNILKFFIYRILYNFMLFLPVWVIFMQDKFGLTLTEVTLNDAAFWITMALTEVPTGAVADTWGRKQSQVIGMVVATLSILTFALAPVYPLVLIANSLWAVGITFISGAELALLYDTLKELGREDEYPLYRGRLQAMVLISIAISSVLGGVIGEFSLVSTFTITALVMAIATVFVLLLKEPPREPDSVTGRNLTYVETLKITINAVRMNKPLRYALLFSSLLPLLGGSIQVTFMQPYAVGIGLPIASLGMIALGIRLSQIIGSLNSSRILKVMSEWHWLQVAPIIISFGIVSLGLFNSVTGIILFALTEFATAVTGPLIEKNILQLTPGTIRATILSVDSLFLRLLLGFVGPSIGVVADHFSLSVAFWSFGIALGIILMLVLLLWGKVRQTINYSV